MDEKLSLPDVIYSNGREYLLTTPEREAAGELLEACKAARDAQGSSAWNYHVEEQLKAAIAKATPHGDAGGSK